MSEFQCVVVEVGKIGKHPNADTLSITHVNGQYPVVFKTGDYAVGDKAVYIPVDSIVPKDDPRWAWLEGHNRIKARKLRGLFSMGMLMKIECSCIAIFDSTGTVEHQGHCLTLCAVGVNVQEHLGIEKYEPPILAATHGANVGGPLNQFPTYDLEAYRRYPYVLKTGEEVVITEKIHGANARFTFQGGQFWVGSHRCWKAESPNIWWQVADKYKLRRLEERPGFTVYGEVFGYVQDLRYGAQTAEHFLAIFDIRAPDGRFLEPEDVAEFCLWLDVPQVPELYRGPWREDLLQMAEGKTTLKGGHVREGIVIQAIPGRFDDIGRVKLKHIGENYYTRKEGHVPLMAPAKEPVNV